MRAFRAWCRKITYRRGADIHSFCALSCLNFCVLTCMLGAYSGHIPIQAAMKNHWSWLTVYLNERSALNGCCLAPQARCDGWTSCRRWSQTARHLKHRATFAKICLHRSVRSRTKAVYCSVQHGDAMTGTNGQCGGSMICLLRMTWKGARLFARLETRFSPPCCSAERNAVQQPVHFS